MVKQGKECVQHTDTYISNFVFDKLILYLLLKNAR